MAGLSKAPNQAALKRHLLKHFKTFFFSFRRNGISDWKTNIFLKGLPLDVLYSVSSPDYENLEMTGLIVSAFLKLKQQTAIGLFSNRKVSTIDI